MKTTLRRFLLLVLVSASTASSADVLGVADAGLLAVAKSQLTNLNSQLSALKKAYDTAENQLNTLRALKSMNEGHSGFGRLNNSLTDLNRRQSAANSWEEALNKVAGNNPSRYKALSAAYEKNHPMLSASTYQKGASAGQYARYQKNSAVNRAVTVESEASYNDINHHLKAVHALSEEIEAATNTKAAIDLNSRLLAEIAYLQTETLKVQTLISQQMAQSTANDLEHEARIAQFNRLPDE